MTTLEILEIPIPELSEFKISKDGKIWTSIENNDYSTLIRNGYKVLKYNRKLYTIHRLIALTFIPNPDPDVYTVINHINEDKLDNRIENLEWVSQKQNVNKCTKDTSHQRRVVRINHDGTEIIYDTVRKAAESVNLGNSAISKVCLGINNTAGGYRWRYENNEQSIEKKEIDLKDAKQIDDSSYYIFKDGSVYNLTRKKFLKPMKNNNNCYYITISNGKRNCKKNHYIRKLVMDNFGELSNKYNKRREELLNVDNNK